jgi:hypothetical protein
MVDLSKKYYAVHVDAGNNLQGIHYIPFSDADIERMKREFDETNEPGEWMYSGACLHAFMSRYLKEKFDYDIQADVVGRVYMFDFDPMDMEAIVHTPENPRRVDVYIGIGEDECVSFNIADAEEEIRQEEGEYDGSVITLANEQEPYNPYIQIHRLSKALPHLTNTLNITNLSMRGWDVRGHIESVEQDYNVTIYHCRNSLFTFQVEVHAHILLWYDENTPIYKE